MNIHGDHVIRSVPYLRSHSKPVPGIERKIAEQLRCLAFLPETQCLCPYIALVFCVARWRRLTLQGWSLEDQMPWNPAASHRHLVLEAC